jgi:LCP family protein required for cell wall assembly
LTRPPSDHASERRTAEVRAHGRSATWAAFFSFLWPGLGQAYAGRRRAALAFALPVLLVAVGLVALVLTMPGALATMIIQSATAIVVVSLVVLIGAWRVVAMRDSMTDLLPVDTRARRRPMSVLAILIVIIVCTHGWLAFVAWSVHDAGQQVFVGERPEPTGPAPSTGPTPSPSGLDEYEAPPFATPETASSRVNVLLIGVDTAENRDTALTDTLLVVSVEPETGEVTMVSFPRDIADFPLSTGGVYTGKINSLMTYAREHPEAFPDGPLTSLAEELGFLLGVPIHYYAAIDLDGFRRMIDVAGGVTIDNPSTINDPTYDWPDGRRGFFLSPGSHHLDGLTATAYVRTRKTPGATDFDRSRRQQQLLLALARQVMQPENLARIPDLTKAAGDTIRTNAPSDRLGEFLELARGLDSTAAETVVLGPPYALRATDAVDYRLRFDEERLARKSIELFGDDSRYAEP